MDNYKCLAIIPARYASSRFPGKPLALLAGKTLIQHTYERAKQCSLLTDIVVATDDRRILDHVVSFGGKAIMTEESCQNGTERAAEVYTKHYLPKGIHLDQIINLQGDEPCVTPDTIEAIVKSLKEDSKASMATAVALIKSEFEAHTPSIVKCVRNSNGDAIYFSRSLIPGSKGELCFNGRTYYKHIGIYSFRPDFLMHYVSLPSTPLQLMEDLEQLKVIEHGFRIKTAVVEHASIGVDTPEDIAIVESYLQKEEIILKGA